MPKVLDIIPLEILIGAVAVFLILLLSNLFFKDSIRRFLHRHSPLSLLAKCVAVISILLLAVSDFYAVRVLFTEEDALNPVILGITFAAFLEGFAFLLGLALSKMVDDSVYRTNSKKYAKVGVWLTLIPLLCSWGLAVFLRLRGIAVSDETHEAYNASGVFLLFSPILTSLLATSISWFAFPSDSLLDQEKELNFKKKRYMHFYSKYQKVHQSYVNAKETLWMSLADLDVEDIPESYERYRTDCLCKIRQKMVGNSIIVYPDQIDRFNQRVESTLADYIHKLSQRTTLPHTISQISVQEILSIYDKGMIDPENSWNSKEAQKKQLDDLADLLDNAAIQAQFHTAVDYE